MMTADEWDATLYVQDLVKRNRIAQDNQFAFARVSGWEGLTEVITNARKEKAFVAIDETTESYDHKTGAGFFETKVYTVFLLHRCSSLNEADRLEKLKLCRLLMRSFKSKMILDAEELHNAMVYLDTEFQTREIGRIVLNGLTGLYFTFSFDRPLDLVINKDEWDNYNVTYGC